MTKDEELIERMARAIDPDWWSWFDKHGDLTIAVDAAGHKCSLDRARRAVSFAADRLEALAQPVVGEQALARLFHETYERLAPSFGYETRADTKAFDPTTANGKLMIAVCGELSAALAASPSPVVGDREVIARIIDPDAMKELEALRAEWEEWAIDQKRYWFGDKPNPTLDPAHLDRLAQSEFNDRAKTRSRALAKADAILRLSTPVVGGAHVE